MRVLSKLVSVPSAPRGYEAVAPFKPQRIDTTDEKARKAGLSPKAMLKADK
jgi:hypothetical protein